MQEFLLLSLKLSKGLPVDYFDAITISKKKPGQNIASFQYYNGLGFKNRWYKNVLALIIKNVKTDVKVHENKVLKKLLVPWKQKNQTWFFSRNGPPLMDSEQDHMSGIKDSITFQQLRFKSYQLHPLGIYGGETEEQENHRLGPPLPRT